jgi:hypothetical protein
MKKWYKSNAKIVVTIDERFCILWYKRSRAVMSRKVSVIAERQVEDPAERSGEFFVRFAVLGAVNDLDHAALDKFSINLEPSP